MIRVFRRRALVTAAVSLLTVGVVLQSGVTIVSADSGSGTTVDTRRLSSHIDAGVEHSCALFTTNTIKCWGRNESGQLGYGDAASRGDSAGEVEALANVNLGTGRTAKAVSAGWGWSCAILDTNALKCWGRNDQGQLGNGAGTASVGDAAGEMGDALVAVNLGTGRTAKAISVGHYEVTSFSCAILDNNTVKCWGYNGDGQLGIESADATRGLASAGMGDALPAVNLGTGRTAVSVSVGSEHACAVLDNGSVKCWGSNGWGQLGIGDETSRGKLSGQMGDALPAVNLGAGRTATAIAAGTISTCAILDNGAVKCWGGNQSGQLGIGNTSDYGGLTSSPNTLAMSALPTVNLGVGRTARSVAVGNETACAVLDNGLVTCWGYGGEGQLGNGGTSSTTSPVTAYSIASGRTATAITLGDDHVCVTDDLGGVRCWGSDDSGRLGTNTGLSSTTLVTSPPAAAINFLNGGVPHLVEGSTTTTTTTTTTTVPSGSTPTTNRFTAVTPTRILDTRIGTGAPRARVAANGEITLTVAGQGGVPTNGATAVVINVTAVGASGSGFVTVYPANVNRPVASNLNLIRSGQTVANLVTVQLSPDGKVRLYTNTATDLLADVAGYYSPASQATEGRFIPLTPTRLFDTRGTAGMSKLAPGGRVDVALLNRSPVPASGVRALVLNVTVAGATAPGFLTVWPTGSALPVVSNLNISVAGQDIANQVIIPVGTGGQVSFYTSGGGHVLADVAGYFTDATAPSSTAGLFTPVVPDRVFDTRTSTRLGATAATRSMTVTMSSKANLPASGMSAVVMNVTATSAGNPSFISAWPSNLTQPVVSTLNWVAAGDTVPNHAIVRVSPAGQVSFATLTSTHLLADSAGWFS